MDAIGFVKKEYLLVISAILAFASLFIVPFNTVLSYDYLRITETICTLLMFLLIVAGLKECNALNRLAQKIIGNLRSTLTLCLALILLPFFCAMLFSNDVALMTFVPLAIAILRMAEMNKTMAAVVVLQTVAANIGSSLTPFGNPHNLYIYNLSSYYGFTLADYESALIPIVAAGTLTFLAITLLLPKKPITVDLGEKIEIKNRKTLPVLIALFAIAILTVVDIIPFYIGLTIIVVVLLILLPKIFLTVDYSILFIFFFLFVFANGMTNVESIHDNLMDLMSRDPMLTTVLVSQFTSNVPSTILLQPFTGDWAAVLVGADIGGFGTPIASMANIITFKLYLHEEDSSLKTLLKIFFLIELTMLAVLIPSYYLFVRSGSSSLGLVCLKVLQDLFILVGPLRSVSAFDILVVPILALLHVTGHLELLLDDDLRVVRIGHPLLRTIIIGFLQESDQEHYPVQVGELRIERCLQHIAHGDIGIATFLILPLFHVMGSLDLKDRISFTVHLNISVDQPTEDLLVMEVVVTALLPRYGFLYADLLAFL